MKKLIKQIANTFICQSGFMGYDLDDKTLKLLIAIYIESINDKRLRPLIKYKWLGIEIKALNYWDKRNVDYKDETFKVYPYYTTFVWKGSIFNSYSQVLWQNFPENSELGLLVDRILKSCLGKSYIYLLYRYRYRRMKIL